MDNTSSNDVIFTLSETEAWDDGPGGVLGVFKTRASLLVDLKLQLASDLEDGDDPEADQGDGVFDGTLNRNKDETRYTWDEIVKLVEDWDGKEDLEFQVGPCSRTVSSSWECRLPSNVSSSGGDDRV